MSSRDQILGDIRASLGRQPDSPVAPCPAAVPPRVAGPRDQEIERFLAELDALKANAGRMPPAGLDAALAALVADEKITRAVLWDTERLAHLGIAGRMRTLGVEILPHTADKATLATADLGITEADFALPETGTVGLYSSAAKPRSVSLVPRVHLAIISPAVFCADLHQVFARAKAANYLVLVTGPSRTSDIELILTIGVHGPKAYYAWVVEDR